MTIAAFACGAASFADLSGDKIVLENEYTRLSFDSETLNLESWYDFTSDQNIFSGSGRSLFMIQLGVAPMTHWASYRACQVTQNLFPVRSWTSYETGDGAVLELLFNDAPVADAEAAMNVLVKVFLPDDSAVTRWHIAVENKSSMPLEEIEFPRLSGINFPDSAETPDREYVVVPLYSGRKYFAPRKKQITGQGLSNYPGGGMSVQMLVYGNDLGGSFYFADYDSGNYTKTLVCTPAPGGNVYMSSLHYADAEAVRGSWSLPYEVAAGPVRGDWYDCAKIYREWTLGFERWTPLHLRSDVMPRFRDLALWWSGHPHNKRLADGNKALAERIVKIREQFFPDITMAYHWYMWYDMPRHDVDYPDVFYRLTENFREDVAEVQEADVQAMLYTNILLYETFLPGWSEAQKYAGRNQLNELNRDVGRGMWRSGDRRFFTGMCFGAKWWVDHITEVYKFQYDNLGCRFFYLDQLCNYPARCFSKSHDHATSGGSYIAEGERQIARNIRNFGAPGEVALVGEGVTECFIDVVDGLLNAHCDTDTDTVPLFQTVYSDRTTEIGIFIGSRDREFPGTIPAKIAFNLVRGRQLGWVNEDQFDIFAPENKEYADYFAVCARVRMAAPEYLFYGEMLREPVLEGVEVRDHQWYTWVRGRVDTMPLADVPGAVYRAPDTSIGVVLANHTSERRSVTVVPDWEDWRLDPASGVRVDILKDASWENIKKIADGESVTVELTPRSATVVRFVRE